MNFSLELRYWKKCKALLISLLAFFAFLALAYTLMLSVAIYYFLLEWLADANLLAINFICVLMAFLSFMFFSRMAIWWVQMFFRKPFSKIRLRYKDLYKLLYEKGWVSYDTPLASDIFAISLWRTYRLSFKSVLLASKLLTKLAKGKAGPDYGLQQTKIYTNDEAAIFFNNEEFFASIKKRLQKVESLVWASALLVGTICAFTFLYVFALQPLIPSFWFAISFFLLIFVIASIIINIRSWIARWGTNGQIEAQFVAYHHEVNYIIRLAQNGFVHAIDKSHIKPYGFQGGTSLTGPQHWIGPYISAATLVEIMHYFRHFNIEFVTEKILNRNFTKRPK